MKGITNKKDHYFGAYALILPALAPFLSNTASRLVGSTIASLGTILLYAFLFAIIILFFRKKIFSMTAFELFAIFFIIFSILLSYIIFPKSSDYLDEGLSVWYYSVAVYLAGKCMPIEKNRQIDNAACIGIVLSLLTYFIYMQGIAKDMSFSYSVLPFVIFATRAAFTRKGIIYKLFVVLGFALLVLLSTRGPILFAAIYFLYSYIQKKHTVVRTVVVGILVLCIVIFLQSSLFMDVVQFLYDLILERFGVANTLLKNILSNSTASMDARGKFIEMIKDELARNPIVPNGMCADRILLGTYVHNVFWEIMYTYGVVIGGLILICIIYRLIKGYLSTSDRNLFVAIVAAFIARIIVSGSFVSEVWLYFGIGWLCTLSRSKRAKQTNIEE